MPGAPIPTLPAQPPSSWADFHRCDIRYGIGVNPSDCYFAGANLAQGADPATYWTTSGHDEAYTLPWSRTVGTCKLSVELSGPAAVDLTAVQLVPDQIRGMSGYVIQRCPGGGDPDNVDDGETLIPGIGGYVTSGMEGIYSWMQRSSQQLIPGNAWATSWTNSRALFVTVTVQHATSTSERAGDTDVSVAEHVLGWAHQLWADEQHVVHKTWYWTMAQLLERKEAEMAPNREDVVWWEPVRRTAEDDMRYTCDNKHAGPAMADCAKLQYQGFGKGSVEMRHGETKYFIEGKSSSYRYKDSTYISWPGTYAVAVSTTKAMTLGWNQISTAFDTLYSLCIGGPVTGPRGGLATYSANSRFEVFGKKRKRVDEVTGLNAVPEGAVINVWRHADNASVRCELAAVLRGQPLDQCRKP